MNYYQHHIGDFNNATRHLSLIERAIYRDLLDMYYDTEKAIDASSIDRLARQSYFDHMEKEMADHVSRSIEPLSGKKQSTLVELSESIEKLAQKYKQDAHSSSLLGDQDKARVYNCFANQLDHLLKGGA
ncbi:YdaU family protein [Acinetobacter baumannii]|uniref:YdaU family protein n=2 Tax=Acinetobacter baumannii TaxID=470 RepID=UPI00034B57B1|nr:YdaU family protein [Acinetobacter baumannii]